MTRASIVTLCILIIGAFSVRVGGQQQEQQQQSSPGSAQVDDEPLPVFGPPPPQTRLEAIASQKGILITKGYTEVGEVPADDGSRLRIAAVDFADARQSRETGIMVSIEQRGNRVPVTAIAYVDADELDALVEALDALTKLNPAATRLTNVEGVYRTRGAFEFTNHTTNGTRIVTVRITQILFPSGQVLEATATLRPARLGEVRRQIAAAAEMLKRPADDTAP